MGLEVYYGYISLSGSSWESHFKFLLALSMIFVDGYYLFLLVGGVLVAYVFLSSSLIVMILCIIMYSLLWFVYLMFSVNQFIWGSLLTLLYLGGMMVLFTYSIMLTGVVSGDFKLLITNWQGAVFMAVCGLTFFFFGSGFSSSGISQEDEVYHFYGGVFVVVSAIVLVCILLFCIIELVEDYV